MSLSNISLERQALNTYKAGFEKVLREKNIKYFVINRYLKLFDKVFKTSNILTTYRSLKITQIKVILDNYAKEHRIDLTED